MRPFLPAWIALAASAAPFVGRVESVDAKSEVAQLVPDGGGRTAAQMGPGDLAIGWSGRRVRGELVESSGRLRLERVFPADPEELRRVAEVSDALRRDTVERGRLAARGTGELAPSWMLWDQSGRLAPSADLRGKPVVLNFIFTRCRSATMCPAASASMASLARSLREAGLAGRVHLVSITFDPAYDSPAVLRLYAESQGLDSAQHRLLTGDAGQIKDLMRQCGIQTIQADGTIVHNAATLLLSSEGRIIHRREGPRFEVEEMLPLVRRETEVGR